MGIYKTNGFNGINPKRSEGGEEVGEVDREENIKRLCGEKNYLQ